MSTKQVDSRSVSDDHIRQFERDKASGKQMIHRLRDWEPGDVIFGYDVIQANGSMSGKTFKRGSELGGNSAIRNALNGLEDQPLFGETLSDGTVAFAWVGRIVRTRQERGDPMDGEPGLKFAELEDVTVLASRDGDKE